MDTIRRHPLLASIGFFYLGVLLVALATPGIDLVAPSIGGVIVLILAVAFYLRLRRSPRSN